MLRLSVALYRAAGELEATMAAEGKAVEAEDFERAAAHSAAADQAKARLARLERELRAAEGACDAAVRNHSTSKVLQQASW